MAKIYFITHPEVVIDPSVEITTWGLTQQGKNQLKNMLQKRWIKSIKAIYSSTETKAIEAAQIISDHLEIPYECIETLGEIDRSATGYLHLKEFEATVNLFFSNPRHSIRGWERAIDAQHRIIQTIEQIATDNPNKNVALVSHGGVGALYLAYIMKLPISQHFDQPSQGHYFVVDSKTNTLVHSWRKLDS